MFQLKDTMMEGRSEKNTILQAVTKIDLGIQSQLLPSPGATFQIYFEITNLRDQPTFHVFRIEDEQHYLQSLNTPS